MAEKVQVDVELSGADKAARGLDDVADAAERVEDVDDVTVEVDADTDDARRGLTDVRDETDELDGRDATITARLTNETSGPLADIFGDLDKLQARAKSASDQLDHVTGGGGDGARFTARGNAVSDLTGPLGDVSGQASDLAGVFDGMGDILEGLAPKMGISAEKMVGAIGGIGFAVTAAAAVWGYFQQKQEEAEERQRKMVETTRKLGDALRDQKFDDAAQQLVDGFDAAFDAADKAKIPIEEVARFLAGYSDDIPTVTARLEELRKAHEGSGEAINKELSAYLDLIGPLYDAVAANRDANDTLATQDQRLAAVSDALRGTRDDADDVAAAEKRMEDQTRRTSEAFDRLRGAVNLDQEMLRVQTSIETAMTNAAGGVGMTADEVLDLKDDIITLAETAKANPAEVKSTLDKIDRGDLAGVKADAESYYARAPVEVTGKLTISNLVDAARKAASALTFGFGGTSAAASSAPVVNVTQHLPRGWRGDALTEARRAARRSGGLYQRARR